MKDKIKIKQLLDRLLIYRGNAELNKWQPEDILNIEDVWILLDYITNLHEENERLKKDYDRLMQDNTYTLELEKRNEKAIEYNQQIIKDTKDFYRPTEDIIYSGDTLIDIAMNNINILQGGDK